MVRLSVDLMVEWKVDLLGNNWVDYLAVTMVKSMVDKLVELKVVMMDN